MPSTPATSRAQGDVPSCARMRWPRTEPKGRTGQSQNPSASCLSSSGEFPSRNPYFVIATAADSSFPPLTFAALTMGHHLSISFLCNAAKPAGVCCSCDGTSWPRSVNRSWSVGSASALITAALRARTNFLRHTFRHPKAMPNGNIRPASPTSSTVGMSGADTKRALLVTANALICPPCTCGNEFDDWSNIRSMCPTQDPHGWASTAIGYETTNDFSWWPWYRRPPTCDALPAPAVSGKRRIHFQPCEQLAHVLDRQRVLRDQELRTARAAPLPARGHSTSRSRAGRSHR